MKQIDTLILGATALAYPLAAKGGESCLVVEQGFSAGAEFGDAMQAAHPAKPDTPLASDFAAELTERGILDEKGGLHILAVSTALSGRFLSTGCGLLLGTQTIEVKKTADGFEALLFTPARGYETVKAARVIDTRVRPFMEYEKTFAFLLAGETGLTEFDEGDVTLTKGSFDDEFILRITVGKDDSISDAHRKADGWFASNRARFGKAMITGMALAFGYRFAAPVDAIGDNGVRYLVSASYPDVLAAVKGGEL